MKKQLEKRSKWLLIAATMVVLTSLNASWTVELPSVYVTWDTYFKFPVFVTIPDSYYSFQFAINHCDDLDSTKILIDSITPTGNGYFVTYWDTAQVSGLYNFTTYTDPPPSSYATIGWFSLWSPLPPINGSIGCVVWGHMNESYPADFDTIELSLSVMPGCPPEPPDTSIIFIDGNIYIVPYLYTRGDVNVSGGPPDLADILFLAFHLFDPSSLPCQRAADCHLDGEINVADVIALVNYLYMGGTLPEPSYPNTCGYNFEDTLPCDEFPPCGYGGD